MMRTILFPPSVTIPILLLAGLSSCVTNYFVDPVPTPVFTAPWQGSVQANLSSHGKLFFEAAGSLPSNLVVVASRESWGHDLINDQEMTSIGFGQFRVRDHLTLLALGGFGAGSQRTGPNYLARLFNVPARLVDGSSDFHKYFLEVEGATTDSINLFGSANPVLTSSLGFGGRIEYLDRYRFNQTSRVAPSTGYSDTSVTIEKDPKHSLHLDLVSFVSVGISFVQLYGQILLCFPLSGYREYLDFFVATAGVRLAF
ncbi:MAG: hypothetical protein Q8922_08240 [Bacteroidota bacterium]|nr:hypothetical protein [Bacteroidota bacterium]MDP4233523.1 hypothetical protein [Bacteroidota bacterium]MDP4243400.1 hypothetical protein [Bacteroidota bacterium]MDP4287913.1 hypothetical protein [Bacteroidota bacterium]